MKKKVEIVAEQEQDQADRVYMEAAIALAKEAATIGEVPVGAVIVAGGEILASAYNLRERNRMATAHAELLAIEEACRKHGDWRLSDACLYVTLEPCPMCTGAIINARIPRVVYGAKDAAAGCCGSLLRMDQYPFNHSFSVTGGVCREECARLLREFFAKQRNDRNGEATKSFSDF